MKTFEQQLEALWEERVTSQHLFHGMGKHEVTDPIDPNHDPFAEVRPQFLRLIGALQQALAAGFQFTVHEDHSGMSFALRDIVNWSKRDLESGGIDFTSSYEDACGYSDNFQGSQLKQNLRYITDCLPDRKDDPILTSCMTDRDWSMVTELNSWISNGGNDQGQVVVWVSSAASVFDDCTMCLPVGSFHTFSRNVIVQIDNQGLPSAMESAIEVLPKRVFCYRIRQLLPLDGLVKIEELGSPSG